MLTLCSTNLLNSFIISNVFVDSRIYQQAHIICEQRQFYFLLFSVDCCLYNHLEVGRDIEQGSGKYSKALFSHVSVVPFLFDHLSVLSSLLRMLILFKCLLTHLWRPRSSVSYSIFFSSFFCGDRVSQCSVCWPQTHGDYPASASQVLTLEQIITLPGSYSIFADSMLAYAMEIYQVFGISEAHYFYC